MVIKRSIFAAGLGVLLIAFALWVRGIAPAHFNVPSPKPPPGPNAFDDFARAASLERDKHQIDFLILRSASSSQPAKTEYLELGASSPITKPQVDKLIADNASAIAALRAGFAHPYFAPPLRSDEQMINFHVEDRSLARLCRFESTVAAQRGDWADSERLSLDSIQLGTEITQHGTLIDSLVGIACDAIGRRTAYPPLDHLNASTAEQDARRLEQVDSTAETPAQALTEEKWLEESELNQFLGSTTKQADMDFLVDYSGGSSASGLEQAITKAKLNLLWMRYPKQKIAADYERRMDAEIRRASLPYTTAARTPDPPVPNDPINGLLMMGYNPFLFKAAYDQTFNALLMTQLALHTYQLDHQGRYPDALDELTPRYLANVPDDPFAPTNAPFPYRLLSGGKAYLLYSVGPDSIDNGGMPIVYAMKVKHPVVQAGDTGDIVAGRNDQ